MVEPKCIGSFLWLSLREVGPFLDYAQEKRVIPLAKPKEGGLFTWLCPREKSYYLGCAQIR
jgi:hypothetical protein